MKKFLKSSTLLFALLLTACSSPSILEYDNTQLNLQIEEKRLHIPGKMVKLNKENFSILFLEQKLLQLDNGTLVMYEEANTDMQYVFHPTTTTTIKTVFDAVKVARVYTKDFIFAYQLVLKDNRVLNIIASQNFDQELQMVYGMSNVQLVKALNRLGANIQGLPYQNAIELKNEQNPILSKWTTWKINSHPLVVPLRRSFRR